MNDATRRACLLPLAALLLAGCGEKEQPPPPPRPVLSLVVQSQHQQSVGHFAGTIQARYETTLGFRTNGRIASRAVDVGDKVAEGALLATLDPTDQQNRLRASEGDRASAEAQWIDAQADARRQEELFTRGVGAKANLDAARTRLKTTRASLDQARAAEQQASDQLAYTRLTTDFDGVVTAWRAEAGQVVAAGQEVVTLARPEVREAVFDLPDDLAEAIPEDARFTVVAQLQGEASTTGHIREMAPQADAATRTRRVRLSLEQTPESFRLGTTVRVELSSPVAPPRQPARQRAGARRARRPGGSRAGLGGGRKSRRGASPRGAGAAPRRRSRADRQGPRRRRAGGQRRGQQPQGRPSGETG